MYLALSGSVVFLSSKNYRKVGAQRLFLAFFLSIFTKLLDKKCECIIANNTRFYIDCLLFVCLLRLLSTEWVL